MTDDTTPQLPCGRPADDIWQTIDQPPDEHTDNCPHCRSARARLANLHTATTQLRHADPTDQNLAPSESVKTNIMTIARAEVRRSRRIPLTHQNDPDLRISEQAVATVIRRAADRIDGVRARRCHITVIPAAAARPDPAEPVTIQVQLGIATTPTAPIPQIHDRVRHSIVDALNNEAGVNTARVDLTVEDITP